MSTHAVHRLSTSLGPPPPVDPDDARRAADEILSRPEYREPQQNVVDRAVQWAFERVGDLFTRLAGGGPGSVVGWVVLAALVATAAYLLVKALRLPKLRAVPTDDEVVYGTESHRDASVWAAEAERLAANGDHRGALRCRHQAMIATAIAAGVVDHVPGRTAAEYRDAIAHRVPSVAATVAELTDVFDGAWYGGRAVTGDDYRAFADAAADVGTAIVDPALRVDTDRSAVVA